MRTIRELVKEVALEINRKFEMMEVRDNAATEFLPSYQGADFYFPATHPHFHLRFTNASMLVANLTEARRQIAFIVLSYGQNVNTVELYRRRPNGELDANNTALFFNKGRVETALMSQMEGQPLSSIGARRGMAMQEFVNRVAGIGLDI